MAEMELEGYTLGQKHRHYNTLVRDAIKNNKTVSVEDFNLDDSDVINLLKIDIASHTKNIEYILKVLTCNDMLYISRAIKNSDWFINDQNYTHIVNPEYLKASLFPQMCTKAIIKFVKQLRNILKDQQRAEQFYYSEENPSDAVKWLPCCSVEFILENIKTLNDHIKMTLLRRLSEKSRYVLEIYIENAKPHNKLEALQACMFLLSSNVDWFLDLVETQNHFPKFNKKETNILMKQCSSRIIDKFDKYYCHIHLPTFIKYVTHENIKEFLIKQAMNSSNFYRIFNLKRLLNFIRSMPPEIRFQFVNDIFINKVHESKEIGILSETTRKAMSMYCNIPSQNYIWYAFAPFNVALSKIKDIIRSKSLTRDTVSLLETVITSAQNNLSHECTFLEYLRGCQKHTENEVLEEILLKLIEKNNFIHYDRDTWNVLNDIFKQIDIYDKSKNSNHSIIETIILYNVIHREKVSEIVEDKFKFNTLVSYHKKLSEREKEMIYFYLYDLAISKLEKCNATNEEQFKENVETLEVTLKLLKDYNKKLENYPTIIVIIKDLVKLRNDQSWSVSMESLYNIKKTWRKLLFEESFALCQNKYVLLNALKHGPSLLERNDIVVKNMFNSNELSLKLVLEKIKIYWNSSIARNITITYKENIKCLGNHKAIARGLSILMPFRQLQELIEKYTPKAPYIDWAKIEEVELSVQQQFAKNMHYSRPQPFPEIIIGFAKGDYLQYALPSLHSIFYNLSILGSQKHIPSLLDAPVSLQKHGIRFAVSKLNYEQLISHFSNIWKKNKNASIRCVMFKTVYKLLCKEKDSNRIKRTWELMEIYIDNLTFEEDMAIYNLLFNVQQVPLEVRGLFYMKSYNFLHRLLNSSDKYNDLQSHHIPTLIECSKEIIEQLDTEFVDGIIFEFVAEVFTKKEIEASHATIGVLSAYLLCATDEHIQLEKYQKTLLPILKQSFSLWEKENFIKNNVAKLLHIMHYDIKKYVIDMNKVNPYKMFLLIQEELQCALNIEANYMILTGWKLNATFLSILNAHDPISNWNETCIEVASEFSRKCVDYLKEDCDKYFPRIYLLFVKALRREFLQFLPDIAYWEIYKALIHDKSFIQGYLAAIVLLENNGSRMSDEEKIIFEKLCKNISEHPSIEIKIHYYDQINNIKHSLCY